MLRTRVNVQLLTADTLRILDAITTRLGVAGRRLERELPEAQQKASLVGELGAQNVAAIGNGANDVDMLPEAGLGIAVIGPEAASMATITAADLVTTSIDDALDLLLTPVRLIATLRR